MSLPTGLSGRVFGRVHGRHLVYNSSWEDPLLDRLALRLGPRDRVVAITSGGCNVLDYVLAGPARVYAVDVNPRQNALLELKMAAIRSLDHPTFFALFGEGRFDGFPELYRSVLRPLISEEAQAHWDVSLDWFSGEGWRWSFYFRGTTGMVARLVNVYIDRVAGVREEMTALLNSRSLEEQRGIYENRLRKGFWGRMIRWLLRRDSTMALVGVPKPQRRQVELGYPGGIARFIEDRVEEVFASVPVQDNYFWRVYLTGGYSPECCPEYLKPENFARLKAGLVDRISVHTASILDFLGDHRGGISRFVLLDHMDWLCANHRPLLARQWQAIVDRAAPGARAIWRSGGLRVDYVDPITVSVSGRRRPLGSILSYHRDLAAELHPRDRVHTYGSFYIADLEVA